MSPDFDGTAERPIPEVSDQFAAGYRRAVVVDKHGHLVAPIEGTIAPSLDEQARGVHIGDLAASLKGDPARRGEWDARLSRARTTGKVERFVDVLSTPGGALAEVATTVFPVPGASGEIEAFVLEVVDRGLAARAEELLRASEARFRALAEALPHMVWESDLQTGDDYFSPRWETFTGRPMNELSRSGYRDLVHPDDVATIDHMTPETFAEQDGTLVFRLRRHDGEYRWMETFATVLRDGAGQIIRIVGGTNDITERRRHEDDARETSAQLLTALSITGLGRFVYNFRDAEVTADARVDEIFGFDAAARMRDEGLAGYIRVLHPDDRDAVLAAIAAMVTSAAPFDEEYRIAREGEHGPEDAWLAMRGRVESDEQGPWRLVGIVDDITDRKRQETLRAVAQRRESLGALIGGIAHDFNNLIGAIAGNAKLAELEVRQGRNPSASLAEILRGADVATDLVRRMLNYSREGVGARHPVALKSVVQEAVSLIRPSLPPTATVECHAAPALPDVVGDRTQLLQIVVNLVTNAGQAIDDQPGRVVVDLGLATPAERAQLWNPDAPAVRLSVSDDGPGMSAAVAARVFEPFFTTKPADTGTGLGLAAVRSVVRAHGGVISLTTAPGAGATFTVVLPAATPDGSAHDDRSAQKPGQAATKAARVLFVDDEHALTRLAERALPLHGLSTTAFTDPQAALDAFAADPDGFAVLVTDQTMPALTGLELIATVRERCPGLPVILSSGYLTTADRERADELGVDAVLPKPCSIEDVVATIRRLTGIA